MAQCIYGHTVIVSLLLPKQGDDKLKSRSAKSFCEMSYNNFT